jgi:Cu2+-exporting ATPase
LGGFGAFYTQQTTPILPSVELEYPLEFYDALAFQQPFLEASETDEKIITLISDRIHCAACIWLIEKAIGELIGVNWVRANLTNKRIRISWQADKIQLSKIMQRLANLGYSAMPFEQNLAEKLANRANKSMLYKIGFAAFTMMNLLWISIAMYSGASEGKYVEYFQWLGFALATPTLFYSGFGFLKSAAIGLKNGLMNMDVPISIGALATYFYSVYVLLGFSIKGEVYFDTVVNFIFVILIGRYLESSAKKSSISATSSLQQLQPKVALVLKNNEEIITPISAINIDERVLIKPGERFPVDGYVLSGMSEADESLLSGEARPVVKKVGDAVFAGSINAQGSLEIKVSKTLKNSVLGKIVSLVENTQQHKSSIVCSIDKIIPYFVGITLFLALLTFIYWYPQDVDLALLSATSVLIITCPCAFGLATPMSIAVASGAAVKEKMLIKNADVFEVLDKVDWVVFDKTGTLTLGEFEVAQVVLDETQKPLTKTDFLQTLASIEKHSEHPLARAILTSYQGEILAVEDFNAAAGQGVSARLNGQIFTVGNLAFACAKRQISAAILEKSIAIEAQGASCIWLANQSSVLGFVALSDGVKADAKSTVAALHALGKHVSILSGDSQIVVQKVADYLNIKTVIAQALPADKANYIKKLQQNHRVLMIGDGVNDAPALVQADSSMAIGSGSDVSVNHADVVLLKSSLSPILAMLNLAKRTNRTIKQNIIFALMYNALMVPLAMTAKVTPLFAAIAMPISSLIVIANAARLRRRQTVKKIK